MIAKTGTKKVPMSRRKSRKRSRMPCQRAPTIEMVPITSADATNLLSGRRSR
jgi:hypothetical protein